jgi:hypothetical protein
MLASVSLLAWDKRSALVGGWLAGPQEHRVLPGGTTVIRA